MKRKTTTHRALCILLALFSLLINQSSFAAIPVDHLVTQELKPIDEVLISKRVLIIYSGETKSAGANLIREGLYERLDKDAPSISLKRPLVFEEFLDNGRVNPSNDFDTALVNYLKSKYANVKLDLVAYFANDAVNFMKRHPELFEGVARHEISIFSTRKDPEVAKNDRLKTLNIILQLLPKTERIVIPVNKIQSDLATEFKQLESGLTKKIPIEVWNDYSFDELYEKSHQLPPNSAILYLSNTLDKTGKRNSPPSILLKLYKASSAPIFVHSDSLLNTGAIGGFLFSHKQMGNAFARKLLGDTKTETPEALAELTGYYFDENALKHWNIPSRNLPKNSVVINHTESIFYTYRWYLAATLFVILSESVLIGWLIRSLRHRKMMALELANERDHLEDRVEERTRELAESEAIVRNLAYYDPLTQLPNRRMLTERFQQAISHCHREKKKFAVMVMDLDKFKAVNDTLGHAAGDELLIQVAERIKACLRENDLVARLGGDEFVILLSDVHSPDDTKRVANALIESLTKIFKLSQSDNVQIGTSIGITFYPQHGADGDVLMDKADTALYQAKDNGRGCFAYYEGD